jgi:hypothetical protein
MTPAIQTNHVNNSQFMKTKHLLLSALALTLPLAGANAVILTTNTALSPGDLTYENQDITVSNCTLTVNGAHSFNLLLLMNGAVLTHSPAPAGETNNRVDLAIAGEMTIDATSRIDVSAKGYGPAAGPGAGTNNTDYPSGAGHGGLGGYGAGVMGGGTYGDLLAPTIWGSGGGSQGNGASPGGAGGGWVRLRVGGVLTVAGQLAADGGSVWAGGGAGGSIHIIAGTLAGTGSITANGGNAGYVLAGGGGGGRIAIYYGNSTFSGGLTALGGFSTSANSGGAGTLYTKANSQSVGDLLLDNSGRTNAVETPITSPVAYRFTLTNVMAYATEPLTLTSLRVSANARLTHLPAQTTGLDLTVTGDVTVDAGGVVSADGKGYGSAAGPGAGTSDYYNPSGGGHGGSGGNAYGGLAGGVSYDELLGPARGGSGGGNIGNTPGTGGAGGGVIQMYVGGTLTVAGQLTANGQSVWASGGAGGSIQIMAATLAGSGSITANGGSAGYVLSGGGGGGRIALYYGSSTFSGQLTALGGFSTSANSGGAGTLYIKSNSQSVGDLLLDNSGRTNAMETLIATPVAYRLTLTNAAAYATNLLTLTGLRVSANGLLTHPFQGPRLQVLVHGNALVQSGGAIDVEGRGYPTQTGPGHGNGGEGSSGAGHGGQGGSGWGAGAGGVTYDSLTEPVDFGSGGGGGFRPNRGGGAIQLTVEGTLTIDGRVSANADQGTCGNCWDGGGSGGSVWLTACRLNGGGSITANGQLVTYPLSGSGGGGRIAIYAGVNQFAGTVGASGGMSTDRPGSAGTTYSATNIPSGLVSWWPGENSAEDMAGPNDAMPVGNVGYAPGLFGTAFRLDGGSFTAPWSPSLLFINGQSALTVECWVYRENTGLPFHVCGMRANSGSVWQIGYDASGPNISPPQYRWTHVALTVEGTTAAYYSDGVYAAGNFLPWGAGPNTNAVFKIGCSGEYEPFIGMIDEMRYYNRALGSNEIAAIYAAGTNRFLPPPTLAVAPSRGGVLFSWPASAAGFGLVSRSGLAPGSWEAVTNMPLLNGTQKEIQLPADSSQRFFRLTKP